MRGSVSDASQPSRTATGSRSVVSPEASPSAGAATHGCAGGGGGSGAEAPAAGVDVSLVDKLAEQIGASGAFARCRAAASLSAVPAACPARGACARAPELTTLEEKVATDAAAAVC